MTGLLARQAPPHRFDRRLLPPMMIGSILNPINSSIIAVALVPISAAFGAPGAHTAWLVSALYLATSIGQPLAGWLVDAFGPRRLYLAGALLTGISGVIGTFAPSITALIVARVVLGFGTCAGYPAAMYLTRSEAQRTGMRSPAGVLAALSVTTQTIAVVGPSLGGLLVQVGGWRATFAINIPLAAACLVLGLMFVPRTTVLDEERRPRVRPDFIGILLFAGTLVSVLVLLMDLRLSRLWLLAPAVGAAAGFTWRELRCRDPFIDLRVFAGNFPLLRTYARSVLAATVSYSYLYGFTQWLESGRRLSPSGAGILLVPTFGVGIIVATVFGRRPRVRWKLILGAAGQVVTAGLLLTVGSDPALWFLVLVTAVVGVPQGLVNLAIQNTLFHQADPARMGASSGLLRTFMYLGAMLASSATGLFFHASADTPGMHDLAWFMLAAGLVFLAITVTDTSLERVDRKAADVGSRRRPPS